MITQDELKWANSTDEELRKIARDWAKKFTVKELRNFQGSYTNYIDRLPFDADEKMFFCYDNMWKCATYAIDVKCFG